MDYEQIVFWSPGMTLEALEKLVVLKAFRHYRGNKTATAHALGIAIRTLDNKFEKYEQDKTDEEKRTSDEKRKRDDFLARSRGRVPNNINGDPSTAAPPRPQVAPSVPGTHAGIRLESAARPPAQSTMPVSERKEVQAVLPKQASQGHTQRRR